MYAVKRWAVLPILALVVTLSGCATSTMQLSPQELQTIRIERVEVIYKPDAFIQWEKVALPYVEKHSLRSKKPWKQVMLEDEEAAKNEYQTIINSPEGKRYMQSVLTAELKRRVGAAIVPKFQGTRPVVLEINVFGLSIPGPAQRVIWGGSPMLGAVTRLKDASTGEELAKLDKAAAGAAGNGLLGVLIDQAFDDLEDRVFDAYIRNLSQWLHTNNRT
ncbi:MAG: hypothetical protein P8Y67_10370 [Alphaproteobacteria bacterium]